MFRNVTWKNKCKPLKSIRFLVFVMTTTMPVMNADYITGRKMGFINFVSFFFFFFLKSPFCARTQLLIILIYTRRHTMRRIRIYTLCVLWIPLAGLLIKTFARWTLYARTTTGVRDGKKFLYGVEKNTTRVNIENERWCRGKRDWSQNNYY